MGLLKKSIPDHSPLEAGPLVCSGCGNVMEQKAFMGHREVEYIEYICRNEETGCSYRLEKKVYVNGEMRGIRSDGTVVKL